MQIYTTTLNCFVYFGIPIENLTEFMKVQSDGDDSDL